MVGRAITATLEAHAAELAAKMDAQTGELVTLRWIIVIGFASLAALMTLLRLFA